MATKMGFLKRVVAPLAIDGVGLVGVGLIYYGLTLIYEPASYLFAGLFMIAAAYLLARRLA